MASAKQIFCGNERREVFAVLMPPKVNLKDILAGVTWTADPRNEATWPRVSDWAKLH